MKGRIKSPPSATYIPSQEKDPEMYDPTKKLIHFFLYQIRVRTQKQPGEGNRIALLLVILMTQTDTI